MEACKREKKEPRQGWAVGGVIFLLLMARACAFGFRYWPQLDDYIQYHNYAAQFSFPELQRVVGVLASRPLAGLADYFLWSPLFDHMILGVALVSALYAACVICMKRLMERYFHVGPVFPVVMALLPLGVEGTYWMSASTRIVVGLACAILAALAFGRWLDRGERPWALIFSVLMLLPFGFYEQSAVLAMTLVLGMAILEVGKHGKRVLLALWTFPAAGLYFAVTGMLSNGGVYGSRAQLMLPNAPRYFSDFLPNILGQIKTVFGAGNVQALRKGFLRGLEQIGSGQLALWAVLAAVLCVLYGWLSVENEERGGEKPRTELALLVGLLLTVAPLTPFLILANPWFSLRGAVSSFPGLALICDTLVMTLWRRLPGYRTGPAVLAALAALMLCVAGVSEIGDYRNTYENDQRAARAVLEQLEEDFPTQESVRGIRVGVLGVEPTFLEDQNFRWHEHGVGCTESSWAFTGLLVSLGEGRPLPLVTPLPTDPIYRRWNAEVNRPADFDALYYYDGTRLEPVTLNQTEENVFRVLNGAGEPLGVIREENGVGSFISEEKKS